MYCVALVPSIFMRESSYAFSASGVVPVLFVQAIPVRSTWHTQVNPTWLTCGVPQGLILGGQSLHKRRISLVVKVKVKLAIIYLTLTF